MSFQEHGDRIGIGRALYNLGNVYHAKVRNHLNTKSDNVQYDHVLGKVFDLQFHSNAAGTTTNI